MAVIEKVRGVKTAKIREYLQGLAERGELDLSKPIPNAKLREWSETLEKEYNEPFNVHTIATVVHEMRLAKRKAEPRAESEAKSESESEAESEVDKGKSDTLKYVGVILGVIILVILGLLYGGGKLKSLFDRNKQSVDTNVNTPISS